MHIDINILTLYNNSGETHQPKQTQTKLKEKEKVKVMNENLVPMPGIDRLAELKRKCDTMRYLTDNQYIWLKDIIENALKVCENENTSYAFKAGYLQSAIETIQEIIQEIPEE